MIESLVAFGLAISEQEHTPDSLKNPCALRFHDQQEAHKGAGGYAAFPTQEAGWRACYADLRAKRERGWSWERIAKVWSERPDVYVPRVIHRFEALSK